MTEDKNVNQSAQENVENADTYTKNCESDAEEGTEAIDYALIEADDVAELCREFPELEGLKGIGELENPLRYAALRDLGLSATEAYLATSRRHTQDNRAHLRSLRTVATGGGSVMTDDEMRVARELFSDATDAQIRRLYKRVTKQ